jgi:hypothetical protein
MKLLKNINVLYLVFLISIINIGWYVYYNKYNSILIFAVCCLVSYLINKNMIIVLTASIIIINILNSLNLVKEVSKGLEGFEEPIENIENIENIESNESIEEIQAKIRSTMDKISKLDKNTDLDIDLDMPNVIDNVSLGKKLSKILDGYEDMKNIDEDEDEESAYMQDKTIIKKLKKLNPVIMDTLMNMTSRDIELMNKSINNVKNDTILDP